MMKDLATLTLSHGATSLREGVPIVAILYLTPRDQGPCQMPLITRLS